MTKNQDILKSEIQTRLETLAYKRTIPFCYNCYRRAPSGICDICHSDDCMRELAGDGIEFGVDWVIAALIRDNVTPVNTTEIFEESVREYFSETTSIGWIQYDTVTAIQKLDPVSFELAESEWIDNEVSDDRLMSFDSGSTYVWTQDVERFLDESEAQDQA